MFNNGLMWKIEIVWGFMVIKNKDRFGVEKISNGEVVCQFTE